MKSEAQPKSTVRRRRLIGLVLTLATVLTAILSASPANAYILHARNIKNQADQTKCLWSDDAGDTSMTACSNHDVYQGWMIVTNNGSVQLENYWTGRCLYRRWNSVQQAWYAHSDPCDSTNVDDNWLYFSSPDNNGTMRFQNVGDDSGGTWPSDISAAQNCLDAGQGWPNTALFPDACIGNDGWQDWIIVT